MCIDFILLELSRLIKIICFLTLYCDARNLRVPPTMKGLKMAPLHQASSDWMWDWKGKGTKGETLVSKTFTRPNMSTYICVCQCNNQWKSRGSVARQFTLIGNTFAGIFKLRALSGIRQLIGHSVIDLLLAPAHTGPPQFQCMRRRDAAQRTQSVHMWRWKEALGL